jgi:hypothetical protein
MEKKKDIHRVDLRWTAQLNASKVTNEEASDGPDGKLSYFDWGLPWK